MVRMGDEHEPVADALGDFVPPAHNDRERGAGARLRRGAVRAVQIDEAVAPVAKNFSNKYYNIILII
jgi:hypothetical protein